MADKRRHGIQIFSAPSDAAPIRRWADAVIAVVTAALAVLVIILVGEGSDFDTAWQDMVEQLPGWVLWMSQATYIVGLLYGATLLIGVTLFAHRRLDLVRDLLLSGALAIVLTGLITQAVDERWPVVALTDLDQTATTFPAFFITALIAIQSAAAPHLSAPVRRIGWIVSLAAVAGALFGGATQPSDTVGAVLVGLFAAAIIRLIFGTSAGVPSIGRIRDGLEEIGLVASDLRYADVQPANLTVVEGTTADGVPMQARVLGRDAWNNSRWSRAWHFAWYQDDDRQYGSSRREQVEHEALAGLLAQRAGVNVAEVLAVGSSATDDGLIAKRRYDTCLADVDVTTLDDALIDRIWQQVAMLHDAGLSHGLSNLDHVRLNDDGAPVLSGATEASVAAGRTSQDEDVAELLTSLALAIGPDRAIASARRGVGDDGVAEALTVLQPAALTPATKRQAKHQKLKIDDLRKQTATALGVDEPALEKLQRVSIGRILTMAVTGIAVYVVISGLADVGFDNIVDALSDATWGYVLMALVLVQMTNLTDAISVAAASPKPVPIGITTLEQFAIGFINLAVPSTAGRVAVNTRFFQRMGINAVTSTTTGAITGVVGFVAQMILLLLAILATDESIDLSDLETGGGVLKLIAMAAIIIVVCLVVVLVVPKLRHWLRDKIRKPLSQMGQALEVMRHPKNVALTLGGALGTEILFASGLTLCVYAVGGSVSLGQVIFINVVVSLFAGLLPIPGGIGVTEAGLTAGLTAVGVPNDTAIAAVLIYRMCSYYLPPIWGWVSMRWLQRHDYL